ncbi:MAG: FAD-binding oxidoreductase, partial [Cyanobacteria bacterium REEB65]|nr:FAD-binding oxidoreductase [Cyanobacteria bacterium REEB65]
MIHEFRVTRAPSNKDLPVDGGRLEADLRREISGEVRFDEGSRALYSTDASNYRQIPIGVVLPKTLEDVVAVHQICARHGAPITSRGGGTSLAGQATNTAVILDHSRYLNRIESLDPAERYAWVQPGVVMDRLRERAHDANLTFAPDPSTHSHCTLGGMIGNNSCGVHSVYGGKTDDNTLELEVVTYDGARLTFGAFDARERKRLVEQGGRKGQIVADLERFSSRYESLIRKTFPPIPRRVSGYNLPWLLPDNGFDIAKALVGSEGTLVTVLRAKMRLL